MIDAQPLKSLIDRNSVERLIPQAKQQRAKYLSENIRIVFVMTGSMVCLLAFVLISATTANRHSTSEAVAQMENKGTKRTLEATDQIERLTTILEPAKAIEPNTAHEIAQLIHQPNYDCDKVTCSAELQARNHRARSNLQTLLAKKALPDENAIHP